MMPKLKIYLVDDHNLFREGLRFLLSNCDFVEEIYEADNGDDFLQNLLVVRPDIVLMDIEMPGINGIEATTLALKKLPECSVIALSMYGNENYYSEMINAGAKGFLLKNSKFDDVQHAILSVYEGKNYFSPEILDSILKNLNKKESAKQNTDLSDREIEILIYICKGFSNQEIADKIFISKRTVDKHRENILQKTQSKNTAELVVYAIKNGIITV